MYQSFRHSLVVAVLLAGTTGQALSQTSVGIGVAQPHPSAVLEVSSNTRGVLLPYISLQALDQTGPLPAETPEGTLVYNYNENLLKGGTGKGFYYFNFGRWRKILTNSDAWRITGNAGIQPALQGIGTLDDEDIGFRRNNLQVARISEFSTVFGNGVKTGFTTWNAAFGSNTLANNTRAYDCTAIGSDALLNTGSGSINAGDGNVGIGRAALFSNVTGESNTAVGAYALYATTDSFNTGLGYYAGSQISTGTLNTAIGANASVLPNLKYAAAIGAEASVTTSNSVVLGGTGAAAVKVGIGVTAPSADLDIRQKSGDTAGIKLIPKGIQYYWRIYTDDVGDFNFNHLNNMVSYINGSTGAFVDVSDLRLKKNINDAKPMLTKTMQLQPKTYRFIEGGPDARLTYGFLAQEVEKLFPEMVETNPQTGMKAISYQDFGVVAIKTIQEQQQMLGQLDQTIAELNKKLTVLEQALKHK